MRNRDGALTLVHTRAMDDDYNEASIAFLSKYVAKRSVCGERA